MDQMIEFVCEKLIKHWKRRKCWLSAFLSFHIMFSKTFFIRVVKSWHYVIIGEHTTKL